MGRVLSVLYGVVAYVIFLGTFLYAVAFIGDMAVPKTIDSGTPGPVVESVVINLALLGLFAIQHSVMARPGFKRLWTRIVPHAIERSTYVLFASLALLLLLWQWRPLPNVVWSVEAPSAIKLVQGISWAGWGLLLISTFLISHFELFGLQQSFAKRAAGEGPAATQFKTPGVYRYVRHPIYLGFLLAFWAAPVMTVGHLLFAVGATGYILIGIFLEERDLVDVFGERYLRYREQVGMLIPWRSGKTGVSPSAGPRAGKAV
jgi:protein-S-isoprenylcysteine O-methyltransferase Ste14